MTTSEELREELRRARNNDRFDIGSEATGGSGTNPEGISRSDVGQEQSIFADLPGSSSEDDTVNGSYDDIERSVNEKSIGVRSADRRSSKNGSSSTSSAETVRGVKRRAGKLEADDPIPIRVKETKGRRASRTVVQERIEEAVSKSNGVADKAPKESKPVQRGKEASKARNTVTEGEGEEQKRGFKLPTFKEGSTLSITEAKALEGPLLSALESDLYYLDQYLWYRTQDTTQAPIWSDMDNEDLQVLTSILLKRGQSSKTAAATVRAIVNGSVYADVTMLMVPRIMKTVQVLKDAPKRQRPSILERKRMAAQG